MMFLNKFGDFENFRFFHIDTRIHEKSRKNFFPKKILFLFFSSYLGYKYHKYAKKFLKKITIFAKNSRTYGST